jgi:hypothetical protein
LRSGKALKDLTGHLVKKEDVPYAYELLKRSERILENEETTYEEERLDA